MEGIMSVYNLLSENVNKTFEVFYHIGDSEPVTHYVGKPIDVMYDYIDEEVGHALTIYFSDSSIECAENNFLFTSGVSTVQGNPFKPYALIEFKMHDGVFIIIEFK